MKKAAVSALVIGLLAGTPQAQAASDTFKMGGLGAAIGAVAGGLINHDERGKGAAIGAAVGGLGGAAYGHYSSNVEREFRSGMESDLARYGIKVETIGENGVNIVIPDKVAFQPSTSTLTPLSYKILDQVARTVASHPDTQVFVTASNPMDPTQHIQLARERAHVTAAQLEARGISPQRMTLRVDSPAAKLEWAGEDLLSRPLYQQYAAGMQQPQHDAYAQQPRQQNTYQGGYRPGNYGDYERRSAYENSGYQPRQHVYVPPAAGASQVEQTGVSSLVNGLVTAVTQGPEAGLRAGAAEAMRGGSAIATREARGVINEEIRDIRYDR